MKVFLATNVPEPGLIHTLVLYNHLSKQTQIPRVLLMAEFGIAAPARLVTDYHRCLH